MDDKSDFSALSKKERRELKRQMEQEKQGRNNAVKKMRNWVIGLLVIGLLGIGGWFGYKELSKPMPGQRIDDLGRGHIPREEWEKQTYNSNPPTSGPHDEQWVKAGVYATPQLEGQLIHSLEHGYAILNYNCNLESEKLKVQSEKLGTESGQLEAATQSAEASASGNLPSSISQQDCDELKKELSDLANDKKLWKLIVVPRPQLDARIAVTAWTYIDKMDSFDKDRIVAFIDAHRNHGPEQTME